MDDRGRRSPPAEKPTEELVRTGGVLHGVQLRVDLPRARKWAEPRYQDLRGNQSVLLTTPDGDVLARVIAGDVAGRW